MSVGISLAAGETVKLRVMEKVSVSLRVRVRVSIMVGVKVKVKDMAKVRESVLV